jgi:hypothetical protein
LGNPRIPIPDKIVRSHCLDRNWPTISDNQGACGDTERNLRVQVFKGLLVVQNSGFVNVDKPLSPEPEVFSASLQNQVPQLGGVRVVSTAILKGLLAPDGVQDRIVGNFVVAVLVILHSNSFTSTPSASANRRNRATDGFVLLRNCQTDWRAESGG